MRRHQENNQPFADGEQVLIGARFLRLRGDSAELQLADGQLVRTPAGNVMKQEAETKAVKGAPGDRARQARR